MKFTLNKIDKLTLENIFMPLVKRTPDTKKYTSPIDASKKFFLSDEEIAESALIGICGESGAGKTVFLTSVFMCIDEIFPNTATDFDRETIGGAAYFEQQETSIRETAKVSPTFVTTNTWAKILLKMKSADSSEIKKFPIYLWDFAGKHFNALADPAYADKKQEKKKRLVG